MNIFFFWFGVVHFVAYALAGFTVATALFVDLIIRRFKLKADLFHAAGIMYKERARKRDGDRFVG